MKLAILAALLAPVSTQPVEPSPVPPTVAAETPAPVKPIFTPNEQHSRGSVTVGGRKEFSGANGDKPNHLRPK